MSAEEAEAYHAARSRSSPTTDADLVTAITMTYAAEAIGIARAAATAGHAGRDLVHGRDRRPAADRPAARRGDRRRSTRRPDGAPAYFMINCAHPTHFARGARGGGAVARADPRHPGERFDA